MSVEIAIVGAGFSGSLLALQILRTDVDARVHLIEKASTFGRGLAYGAAGPEHLLNVRAANMSAFPDAPSHFFEWLQRTAPADSAPAFVSRTLFGTYLQALLAATVQTRQGAGRLFTICDEAIDVAAAGARLRVRLALGSDLEVDAVVLATGNLPPHDLACFADADPVRYVSDPWQTDAFSGWSNNEDVLLVGSGLTAVDMLLRLRSRGNTGRITAVSRHGLTPHRHAGGTPTMEPLTVPSTPRLSALVRFVRQEAASRSWHEVIDGLRPSVQRLWCEATLEERRRFLRHLRPWWDIHRHRLAPSVANLVDLMVKRGDLSVVAGRIEAADVRSDGIDVTWRPRGTHQARYLHVGRVVNCTGPAGDLGRVCSPLLRSLLVRGMARPDACGLGLDVDADCHLIDEAGVAQPRLLAVGPMSRGAFWEIVAVPDIRIQALRTAADLSGLSRSFRGD